MFVGEDEEHKKPLLFVSSPISSIPSAFIPTPTEMATAPHVAITVPHSPSFISPISVTGNHPWTSSEETLLTEWAEEAHNTSWLHQQAALKYKNYDTFLRLQIIIIGSVAALGNTSLAFANAPPWFVNLIIGGSAFLSTTLNVAGHFFDFTTLSNQHQLQTIGWKNIDLSICTQLALPISERLDCISFFTQIRQNMDSLRKDEPLCRGTETLTDTGKTRT